MNKLKKILLFTGLTIFCSYAYSQEPASQAPAVQEQETTKGETSIPVKCTKVISLRADPARLVVDSKGTIYVNASKQNTVDIINKFGDKEGEISLADANCPPPWQKDLSPITGLDIDLNDDLYLCNGGHITIEKLTAVGELKKKIVIPPNPGTKARLYDVVVDEEGTIYAAAQIKFVYIYDKDGNFLKRWVKPDEKYGIIGSIAIDRYKTSKQKRIYLGDIAVCRVYVFSKKDKKLLFSFGNRGTGPGEMLDIIAMDIDSEGYIYVLDRTLGYCSVFNPEGKFVFRFGHGEVDGEKNFYFPMSIFIDQKDMIYISNTYKKRILVWEWKEDRKKFKQ